MESFYSIILFALAGFVSAAFYTPLKYVKWSWEIMWIFYALFACLLAPMIIASIAIPSCWEAISEMEMQTLMGTFLLGSVWGVGGLTFGLSMRYLGIGLGTAVALGFCALIGTLFAPIKDGTLFELLSNKQGLTVLVGVFICALGIAINGVAGIMKENDMSAKNGDSQTKSEFNLVKGFSYAIIAGAMSAGMSMSLDFGKDIAEKAKDIAITGGMIEAQANLFKNSATLIVTLLGGFCTNFFWCLFLGIKNKTISDLTKTNIVKNIIFVVLCALGGTLWYCQFFLYGMGQTKLAAEYAFASWAILMAFIIVFAGIVGLIIGEWKGTKVLTKTVLWLGILVLATSTFVMSA